MRTILLAGLALLVLVGVTRADMVNEFSSGDISGSAACQIEVTAQPGGDIGAQFNNAIQSATANNMSTICWKSGTYTATTQLSIPLTTPCSAGRPYANLDIWAYGVVLKTVGAINGLIDLQGCNENKTTIHGLRINNDNPLMPIGFKFGGVAQGACVDCGVITTIQSPAANFINMQVGNRVDGDTTQYTQSFRFERPYIKGLVNSTDSTGINIQRAANVSVMNGTIFNTNNSIVVRDDPLSLDGIISYETLIEGNDLESFNNAAVLITAAQDTLVGFPAGGIRIINNTIDRNFAPITGSFIQFGAFPTLPLRFPVFTEGNMIVSNVAQYVINPNNQPVTKLDGTYNSPGNLNTGTGPAGFVGPQMLGGLNVDALSFQPGTINGVQGSVNFNPISPPDFAVVSTCTGTCVTNYCYQVVGVDYYGRTTGMGVTNCNSLSAASLPAFPNRIRVISKYTGTAGYQIYGRGPTTFGLLDSGKTVQGTPVTLLSTDSTVDGVGLNYIDDGSLTPGASAATGNKTGRVTFSAGGVDNLRLISTPIASMPGFKTAVNAFSPVAYWPFGDTTPCATIADISGNANTGTVAGTVTCGQAGLVPDESTTSALFNGTTGTVGVATSASLSVGDTFTVLAMIKFTGIMASGTQAVVEQDANGGYLVRFTGPGQLGLFQRGGSAIRTGANNPIQDTLAHMITVTKNPATAQIYIDGNPVGLSLVNAAIAPANAALHIGATSGASNFANLTIGNVVILPVSITPAQVQSIYMQMSQLKDGMLGYASDRKCGMEHVAGSWVATDCGITTIAALPTCDSLLIGGRAMVNNADACVNGATPVHTTGVIVCPVACDGSVFRSLY